MRNKTTWIITQTITFLVFFILLAFSVKNNDLTQLVIIYFAYPISWAYLCSLVERKVFPINWKRNSIIRILSVVVIQGAITFFIMENMIVYEEQEFIPASPIETEN